MPIQRLSPDTMHKNPAFAQLATVSGGMTLVFVGGQNGVTKDGKLVGRDVVTQSEQALRNVQLALEAAGATFHDVVKFTIYLVQGHSLQDAYGAVGRVIPKDVPPATVSVLIVAGLANPDYVIEIEAVAAVAAVAAVENRSEP
ncbi:MAG: RidA family protein [bacterium]|nr:RidA family protein [bacterium]